MIFYYGRLREGSALPYPYQIRVSDILDNSVKE